MDDVMSRPGMLGFPIDLEADPQPLPPFPSRFGRVLWEDCSAENSCDPLIKGLLNRGELSVIFGGIGSGKSFFALDLAAHVALGWDWRGRKVRQGVVVYIAAEGGRGFQKRVAAFRQAHRDSVTARDKSNLSRLPFVLLTVAPDLGSKNGDVEALIDELRDIEREYGSIELVVIDTLSRCFSGDENSSKDMGQFVRNCDAIREATGAHVSIVHHSGKDGSKGARGHSLLRAAVDTEIELTPDKSVTNGGCHAVTATVTKQKDYETGAVFAFTLKSVFLGHDQDGAQITSYVVEETAAPKAKGPSVTGRDALAFETLKNLIATEGEHLPQGANFPSALHYRGAKLSRFRDEFFARVVSGDTPVTQRQAFKRTREKLQSLGLIAIYEDWVWIP